MTLLATVQLNHLLRVDGVESVRVDHDTKQPRIGLKKDKQRLITRNNTTCLLNPWMAKHYTNISCLYCHRYRRH